MVKDQFDRDLEEYLHVRKHSGFSIKKFFSSLVFRPKRISPSQSVPIYESPGNVLPLEHFFSVEPTEELMQTTPQLEDFRADIKEIARIALLVVRTLDDEALRQFKTSPDYETLKNILKKHELIQ